MKLSLKYLAFILPVIFCMNCKFHPVNGAQVAIRTVPLFESAGVYVNYGDLNPEECKLAFRRKGDDKWQKALTPVNVINDREFRGSIVKLSEETDYELDVFLSDKTGNMTAQANSEFRTWSSNPKIAKTIKLESSGPLEIKDVHGTADGWIRYYMGPGAVIEAGKSSNNALLIKNSSFVIFENLTLKGGDENCVEIIDSENIRITACNISGWGKAGKQIFSKDLIFYGGYYDEKGKFIWSKSGVFINNSMGTVIERCYIHDPRGTSQAWTYSHPYGPIGIFVKSKGATVIRYNDIIGSDSHRWNDVIGSKDNFTKDGGLNQDADVYGNMLAFANDDGVELDGGQKNVRFFRNKIEGCFCGVSTVAAVQGPSYIFENLIVNQADEKGKRYASFKCGGNTNGKIFFLNNTINTQGFGITCCGKASFYGMGRNNIFSCSGTAVRDKGINPANSFDYDLLDSKSDKGPVISSEGQEKHGVTAEASFKDTEGAIFALKPGSRGEGEGIEIPNFTPAGNNGKVNMGAFQSGTKTMLPYRPLPVSCDKFQINLKSGSKDTDIVTLTPDSGSNWSSKFKVMKNDAFDWLNVEPVNGTLEAGKKQDFKVGINTGKISGTAPLKGLFLIRMENGLSIPVTVYLNMTEAISEKTE